MDAWTYGFMYASSILQAFRILFHAHFENIAREADGAPLQA